MSEEKKSGSEKMIEAVMDQLDPDSPRFHILAAARRFKSSWVELGDKLTHVRSSREFEQWGYDDFYDYCSREIRIRKPTADKLAGAFKFLEKHEPVLFDKREEAGGLPDYRSVDMLRQAHEMPGYSDEDYQDLRKMVVDEKRSTPAVAKRFKEMKDQILSDSERHHAALKIVLSAARRFSNALSLIDNAPDSWRSVAEEAVAELEARAEEDKE